MSPTTESGIPHPEVSVIVVNWNVADLCVEAIDSLFQRGGIPREELELFLIDNHSSDDSLETLHEHLPGIDVIANDENVGFGRANSQVFPECRGRYVFLLNPDTIVTDGALRRAVELMDEHPDWGILGLRLLNPDGSFQRAGGGSFPGIRSLAWNYLWLNRFVPRKWSPPPLFLEGDPQGRMEIDWVSGAALLLRPDACNNTLFDPTYWMYGEDIDLCWRVAKNGHKVMYTSEASIIHLSQQSMAKQQDGDLIAAPVKGPRSFYQGTHGGSHLWLYDGILVVGLFARTVIYRLADVLKPGRDYLKLSRLSFRHLKTTLSHFGRSD